MPSDILPRRIDRAVALLNPAPGDKLLEIGCGSGVATAHLAATAQFAQLVAIDRSPVAVTAAKARVAALPLDAAGRARIAFRLGALASFNPGALRFDRIFAINVNLFWLDAARELAVLGTCLAPRGRLLLFYAPPVASKNRRILAGLAANLEPAGFVIEDVAQEGGQKAPFLAVAAKAARG
jgi:protein-L-isoaspartate O-methyltransferase